MKKRKTMQKRKVWKVATILLILILLLTSCISVPKNNIAVIPDPIKEDGTSCVTFHEDEAEDDQVHMPLWYWKKIVRYIIDTSE